MIQLEHLFVLLKQHELEHESTQLVSVAAIKRLCLLSLGAVVRILQSQMGRPTFLVRSRSSPAKTNGNV